MRKILISMAAAALTIMPVTGAQALAPSDTLNAQARMLYANAQAGRLTAADRAFLHANPDLRSVIPDAAARTTGETTTTIARTAGVVAMAATCRVSDRYQQEKALDRTILWEYHTRVSWCYENGRITSGSQYAYFAKVESSHYVRATDSINRLNKPSASSWQTHNQGAIEQCVIKYGCIGIAYPVNKVTFTASGTTSLWWTR